MSVSYYTAVVEIAIIHGDDNTYKSKPSEESVKDHLEDVLCEIDHDNVEWEIVSVKELHY